jgi:hypothetical protein
MTSDRIGCPTGGMIQELMQALHRPGEETLGVTIGSCVDTVGDDDYRALPVMTVTVLVIIRQHDKLHMILPQRRAEGAMGDEFPMFRSLLRTQEVATSVSSELVDPLSPDEEDLSGAAFFLDRLRYDELILELPDSTPLLPKSWRPPSDHPRVFNKRYDRHRQTRKK